MANKILYRSKIHGKKTEESVYAFIPIEYARAIGLKRGDWVEWELDLDNLNDIKLKLLNVPSDELPKRKILQH